MHWYKHLSSAISPISYWNEKLTNSLYVNHAMVLMTPWPQDTGVSGVREFFTRQDFEYSVSVNNFERLLTVQILIFLTVLASSSLSGLHNEGKAYSRNDCENLVWLVGRKFRRDLHANIWSTLAIRRLVTIKKSRVSLPLSSITASVKRTQFVARCPLSQ